MSFLAVQSTGESRSHQFPQYSASGVWINFEYFRNIKQNSWNWKEIKKKKRNGNRKKMIKRKYKNQVEEKKKGNMKEMRKNIKKYNKNAKE